MTQPTYARVISRAVKVKPAEISRGSRGAGLRNVDYGPVPAPPSSLDSTCALLGNPPVVIPVNPMVFLFRRIQEPGAAMEQFLPRIPRHVAETLVGIKDYLIDCNADSCWSSARILL